mmetsp:Transcript_37558/g.118519  ORF Transcript_37558/g.118519 Transcript_37558/m.118519 type:complete len:275 (-) Transcript_37558:465-1289(-)
MQSTRASSPRRPRPADHEFGYKTEFETKSPGLNQDKAQRAGQQASAPYGKLQGHSESMVDVDPFAVKMQLRHMFLGFVDKSAPDLEEKPPAALSVEAGDASKLKFIDNLPEWVKGSDEFPRGVHGEGRKEWYGQDGHRAAIARIPTSGSSSETDRTEYRLQPATAHGFDVGFERTMAHNSLRSHGSQLQEKDLGEENFQTPSGGYVPSGPNRQKHNGSDGNRAQAFFIHPLSLNFLISSALHTLRIFSGSSRGGCRCSYQASSPGFTPCSSTPA